MGISNVQFLSILFLVSGLVIIIALFYRFKRDLSRKVFAIIIIMDMVMVITVTAVVYYIPWPFWMRYTYYVDQQNTTGPWEGTKNAPFRTIQEGLDAAEGFDRVSVKGGYYNENLRMNPGTMLNIWQRGPVRIEGNMVAPVIRANINNSIYGFTLVGGEKGILLELGSEELKMRKKGISITVVDCEIKDSYIGIEVRVAPNISLGQGVQKTIKLDVQHNWIHDMNMAGILSVLNGPSTGMLKILLDVKDNVIRKTETGIALLAEGAPNPRDPLTLHTYYFGDICNNLIDTGRYGISLDSERNAYIRPTIAHNTIIGQSLDGINMDFLRGTGMLVRKS